MAWTRQDFQRPVTLQIDLNQATYQAFLNCINSFQGLETTSAMEQGQSVMVSRVSLERFVDNLGVLAGLTHKDGFDVNFTPTLAFKYWDSLVKYLEDAGFFKRVDREDQY